jgi:hypothetical protein
MSQAGIINTTSGPVPPTVPTSFVTDNGTAVPAANILIIHGLDSSENNDNGIIAKGGVVGTGTANEVDVVLTNRQTGTITTADATPTTILTFALSATPGVYYISGDIVAFDTTDTAGAAYGFISGIRSTGAAAVEIATELKDIFEEAALMAADFTVTTSGNNVLVNVIGIAAKTIDWSCMITYRFVS